MALKLADAFVFFKGDTKNLDKTFSTTEKKTRSWTSNLGGTMKSLIGGAIGGMAAVYAQRVAKAVIGAGKEMIVGAMELQGVAAGYEATVQGLGVSSEEMLKRLREGSAGIVKDTDLMKSFNLSAQLVSKEFAGGLPDAMQYFRKVSASTGTDLGYLIDSYVRGIGRLSPMILDNLGVQVDLNTAYEDWAAANGKAVTEMTKTEQQAALTAQVMEKLKNNTADLPDITDNAAVAAEQFAIAWENFKDTVGTALLPLITEFIGKLTDLAVVWLPKIASVIENYVVPALGDFWYFVESVINMFKGDPVFEDFANFFYLFGDGVGDAATKIGLFANENIPLVKEAISDLQGKWEEFATVTQEVGLFSALSNLAYDLGFDDIGDSLWHLQLSYEGFVNVLIAKYNSEIVPMINGFIDWYNTNIVPLINEMWPRILEGVDLAIQAIDKFIGKISEFWFKYGDEIMAVVIKVWQFLIGFVVMEFEFFIGLWLTWMKILNGDWEGAWEEIQTTATKMLDALLAGLGTSVDEIITELKIKIVAWKILGQDWIQGLIDGIKEKAEDIKEAIIKPVRDAIEAVKRLLDTNSPSRVFMDIGRNTMLGMEQGIEGAGNAPVSAVSKVTGRLAGAGAGGFGGGGMTVTLSAPLIITAGTRYEAERLLEPIIRSVMEKSR